MEQISWSQRGIFTTIVLLPLSWYLFTTYGFLFCDSHSATCVRNIKSHIEIKVEYMWKRSRKIREEVSDEKSEEKKTPTPKISTLNTVTKRGTALPAIPYMRWGRSTVKKEWGRLLCRRFRTCHKCAYNTQNCQSSKQSNVLPVRVFCSACNKRMINAGNGIEYCKCEADNCNDDCAEENCWVIFHAEKNLSVWISSAFCLIVELPDWPGIALIEAISKYGNVAHNKNVTTTKKLSYELQVKKLQEK